MKKTIFGFVLLIALGVAVGAYGTLFPSSPIADKSVLTASETESGTIEIATNEEAVAKTSTDKALVPSNIPYIMASPGDIGGTAPAKIYGTELRVSSPTVPSTAGDTCVKGDISWDADYLYICVATNTFKRVPLTTW